MDSYVSVDEPAVCTHCGGYTKEGRALERGSYVTSPRPAPADQN